MTRSHQVIIAAWLAAVAGCGSSQPTESSPTPASPAAIRIEPGPEREDTALAEPARQLVVLVVDSSGSPVSGTIEFVSPTFDPGGEVPSMWLRLAGDAQPRDRATVRASARGEAGVFLKFGPRAGGAWVRVTLPGVTSDSVEFTIRPGAPARIALDPPDTAVYVGNTVHPRVDILDQNGNQAGGSPSFRSEDETVATVTADGVLTGRAFGSTTVEATLGSVTGWMGVAAVPRGVLAAHEYPTDFLVRFELDGSGYRRLTNASPGIAWVGIAWSSDGGSIVLSRGSPGSNQLVLVDQSTGAVTPLTPTPGTTLVNALWPSTTRDGQWIYFTGEPVAPPTSFQLWRVRPDGSGLANVPVPTRLGQVWYPSVSPDGSLVAYTNQYRLSGELAVYELATQVQRSWSVIGGGATWSPAGTEIAYVDPASGAIRISSADGSTDRALSQPGRVYAYRPISWSPDGEWIAAQSADGLDLIRVSTGLVVPLPYSRNLLIPSWRPVP